jgi:hypothetical protein
MAFWNILYSWYWYSVQSLCGSRTAGYRSGYIWVHEHCGTIRANGAQLVDPDFPGLFSPSLDQESSAPRRSALARILGGYLRDLLEYGGELTVSG